MTLDAAQTFSPDIGPNLAGVVLDGRYRVIERLGRGGMGTVWLVQHVESLQHFALKTLHARLAREPSLVRRLLREARSAGSLHTRHVVRILDARTNYEHQGEPLPFLVMEYLRGRTLEQVLEWAGPLTPGETAWLVTQLARGLGQAHAAGIVHRDLKPSNVFIVRAEDDEPLVKLVDFGIVKVLGETRQVLDATETETGAIVGTPMYMAPEQLRNTTATGPATDQWSLAHIVYKALTGQDYFARANSSVDLVLAVLTEPLEPPSSRANLNGAFDEWFLRSCQRDPEARWQNVQEQVRELVLALGSPNPVPIGWNEAGELERVSSRRNPRSLAPRVTAQPASSMRSRRSLAGLAVVSSLIALGAVANIGPEVLGGWLGGRLLPTAPAAQEAARADMSYRSTPLPSAAPSHPSEPLAPSETKQDAKAAPPEVRSPVASRARAGAQSQPKAKVHGKDGIDRGNDDGRGSARAEPQRLPSGSPCARSAQCASGLCLAETCR